MSLTPTLRLYKDTNYTPTEWWMEVELDSTGSDEFVSHGTVPSTASPGYEFHIDVNIQSPNNGNVLYEIDLGALDIDEEDGEIHIHLMDASSNPSGGGIVKAEDANQATKPIPSL